MFELACMLAAVWSFWLYLTVLAHKAGRSWFPFTLAVPLLLSAGAALAELWWAPWASVGVLALHIALWLALIGITVRERSSPAKRQIQFPFQVDKGGGPFARVTIELRKRDGRSVSLTCLLDFQGGSRALCLPVSVVNNCDLQVNHNTSEPVPMTASGHVGSPRRGVVLARLAEREEEWPCLIVEDGPVNKPVVDLQLLLDKGYAVEISPGCLTLMLPAEGFRPSTTATRHDPLLIDQGS